MIHLKSVVQTCMPDLSILYLINHQERYTMTQINYVVKVKDTKLIEVKKALTEKGIDVVSIVEVHKEDIAVPVEERPEG